MIEEVRNEVKVRVLGGGGRGRMGKIYNESKARKRVLREKCATVCKLGQGWVQCWELGVKQRKGGAFRFVFIETLKEKKKESPFSKASGKTVSVWVLGLVDRSSPYANEKIDAFVGYGHRASHHYVESFMTKGGLLQFIVAMKNVARECFPGFLTNRRLANFEKANQEALESTWKSEPWYHYLSGALKNFKSKIFMEEGQPKAIH